MRIFILAIVFTLCGMTGDFALANKDCDKNLDEAAMLKDAKNYLVKNVNDPKSEIHGKFLNSVKATCADQWSQCEDYPVIEKAVKGDVSVSSGDLRGMYVGNSDNESGSCFYDFWLVIPFTDEHKWNGDVSPFGFHVTIASDGKNPFPIVDTYLWDYSQIVPRAK